MFHFQAPAWGIQPEDGKSDIKVENLGFSQVDLDSNLSSLT